MAAPAQSPDDAPLIVLEDVHFAWEDRPVFAGLSLSIPRGRVTTIMGTSGSGKTTLLRLITGQVRPTRGRILVDGEDVTRLSAKALFRLRMRMGMMFQSSALFTDLSVFDNVAFPLREHTRLPESIVRTMVLMKLQLVGLRGARDLMPAQLSGGMTRRVALARAIVMDPMLVMYDDPFSGQDPVTLGVLQRLIRQLNADLGLTSVVVSHDVDEVAAISDYLYIIGDGVVKDRGTPAQLGRHPGPYARQFLEGLPDGPAAFHYPAPPLAEDLFARERE